MKWVARIVGAMVLVIVMLVVGVLLLPADRIAQIAGEQLHRLTGRNVSISGDVSMTFWPVLGVSAGELTVGNADWAREGTMLATRNAVIGIDAAALLRGDIRITNIAAESPTIRLESRKDGRASWQFENAGGDARIEAESGPGGKKRGFSIEKLTITDATLIYEAEGAAPVEISGVDLALDWPEPAGEARVSATLRPAGEPVRLEAVVGGFASFLGGEVQPLTLTLATVGGEMSLRGRAALDGSVAGDLRLDTRDTALFLTALGAERVDISAGLGQQATLSTTMTLTPDRALALRELVADLGGNGLRGAADITLRGTPRINAELAAGALDLRPLTAPAPEGAAPAGAPVEGWSRDPIDASALSSFDGAIALVADSIDLGAMQLGATRLLVTNDRARMVIGLREVQAYDGVLAGEFVMNNRNGLSVGGNLAGTGVALNPLLRDLAGLSRFTGDATAEVSFLGVGQSVDAIMKSLSGAGRIALGRGSIEGIDLDDLMGNFDVQGGTTVFDSAQANFTMQDGALRNNDLQMLLPHFDARGAGTIDLGARRLDYTLTPRALRVNGDRGLAVPIRITGPWADPSIRADLSAALDLNFSAERDRAETKVKEKLEEKLAEELGVVRQEGQSIEEAVEDRLENKLAEELFKLFD